MRRIAILSLALAAALPAFSQTAPKAAAPAQGAAPAAAPAPTGPHPKSAEENTALLAMFKAQDPDSQIKAAQALLDNFADTDYKAQAYSVLAQGNYAKKDFPKAVIAGEKSLEIDPNSYDTLILMSEVYSRSAKPTDLDLDTNLAKVDKYAKQALTILATAQKPKPDLADADWANAKRGEEARAWLSLGFSAALHKKYDEAKTDFDKGIGLYPDPLDMLYIERQYTALKRYDDALAWIGKAMASPNANDQLKQIADKDKTRVEALKKAAQ